MRGRAYFLIAALSLVLGAPVGAQDANNGSEQAPIVVQGQRNPDQAINDLVNSLPPAPANGHIERFEHTACPVVLGVSPRQRATVVARMRAVGAAGGVVMGAPDCRPNVLILITSNKRQFIEQLATRFPTYFGELSGREIERLAQSPGPTALWHLNGMVDADGRQFDPPSNSVAVLRTTRAGSRLTDQVHSEFIGSALVIESAALEGLTTIQLADYAAMRTFTGADPARLPNRNLPTILTLLDTPMGSAAPVTLTDWDLAFLGSLYTSDPNIHAPGQRGEIQAGMRRDLERAGNRREPN
jgi:hypothetical protein